MWRAPAEEEEEEEEEEELVAAAGELAVEEEAVDVDGRADRRTMAVDSEGARWDMTDTGPGDGLRGYAAAAAAAGVAVDATAAPGPDCRSKAAAGR
jgi:hypothetical protein